MTPFYSDLILRLVITLTAIVTIGAVMMIVHTCIDGILNLIINVVKKIKK